MSRLSTDSHVLCVLLDRGAMTCDAITQQVLRHKSVIHRSLTGLERIGLVERERFPHANLGNVADLWRIGQRVRLGVARDGR